MRRHDEIDVGEHDLGPVTLCDSGCDERYVNGNDLRMSAERGDPASQRGLLSSRLLF